MSEDDQRRRVLNRKVNIGFYGMMLPGSILMFTGFPWVGILLSFAGASLMLPAAKRLADITPAPPPSVRKRCYWLLFGPSGVLLLALGWLCSRGMTPMQRLLYWLTLAIIYGGLMIWAWWDWKRRARKVEPSAGANAASPRRSA